MAVYIADNFTLWSIISLLFTIDAYLLNDSVRRARINVLQMIPFAHFHTHLKTGYSIIMILIEQRSIAITRQHIFVI